jgi:hypothetical protein
MMNLRLTAITIAVFALASIAYAQDIPAASRGDIEAGATFSTASPKLQATLVGPNTPYPDKQIWGGSAYVNFNFTGNLGLVAQFDYPTYHTPEDYLEKSYLLGLRYIYPVHVRYVPYVKVLAGIASTSYDKPANWIIVPGTPGTYGAIAFGGGLDIRFRHKITVRAIDFQLENWSGFPGGAVTPYIISIGAAYRIR